MQTSLDSFFKPKQSSSSKGGGGGAGDTKKQGGVVKKGKDNKKVIEDTKKRKEKSDITEGHQEEEQIIVPPIKKTKTNEEDTQNTTSSAATTTSTTTTSMEIDDAMEDTDKVLVDTPAQELKTISSLLSSSSSKKPVAQKQLSALAEAALVHLAEDSWKTILGSEFSKPYFSSLLKFVAEERANEKNKIYPAEHLVFNALNSCSFGTVRVVILGQDPYFNPGQAMGLSFSVPPGQTIPPSLRNIYKEMKEDPDLDFTPPKHGDLSKWAQQGVLLLNTVLTVRGGQANSHQSKGWEIFTDFIIDSLNTKSSHGVVFMLWGVPAQKKSSKINSSKHCILKAAHPSPLSAHNGFFGCQHFSKANKWLVQHKLDPIEWQL